MELEGSLKAFSLPEILQFLAMGKLTGTLMVRSAPRGIDLVIHQGRIVNSMTLDHTRRLGQMLVYRRLIRRSDLDDVLYDQQLAYKDKMLGQLLIDRELIKLDDLRQVIKSQLEEEIWELFSWEAGEFRFEHMTDSDIKSVLVEIDIEPLIIEGSRRIDEWKAIIRSLRGDRTVVGLNPWNPEARADLTLTPAEWQVLSYINGRFSIGSIAARAGIGKFETYRILNAFLAAGIVSIREKAAGGDEDAGEELPGVAEHPETVRHVRSRLGLFGKKRSGDVALDFGQNEAFFSALGLVARFINLVTNGCFEHRDFSFVAGDEQLLEYMWGELVMEYPFADLVRVDGNLVDVDIIERYLMLGGFDDSTIRAYEDSLEGLRRLYGMIATVFAQRMGERSFQRIVHALQSGWLPGARIEEAQGFDFPVFLSRSTPPAEGVG